MNINVTSNNFDLGTPPIGNGLTILGVEVFLQDVLTGAIVLAAVLFRRIGDNGARGG